MTYQRPAYEQVTIAHGGNTVTLRPSLRAAATLEARYGFPALVRALDDLNLTIISEIILTASSWRQDAAAFLSGIPGRPLLPIILAVAEPLAQLVSMLTPAPVQSLDTTARAGKPMPWSEFYAGLYDTATGWLGWTPEVAWNATPTEITRAFSAHIEKLKAIHGSTDDKSKPTAKAPDPEQAARNVAAGLDPEFDRSALRALKMKIAGAG